MGIPPSLPSYCACSLLDSRIVVFLADRVNSDIGKLVGKPNSWNAAIGSSLELEQALPRCEGSLTEYFSSLACRHSKATGGV
jgi:hypothetical protein